MHRKKQPPPTVSQTVHLRAQALEQLHQAEGMRGASDDLWARGRRVAQRAMRHTKQLRAEGRGEDAVRELRTALGSYPSAAVRLALASALLDLDRSKKHSPNTSRQSRPTLIWRISTPS
jgi:hypothetical protein